MSDRARSLGLGERLEVEAALEAAFAPLRTRRSTVGPTRVRAAVRWGRAEPEVPVPWAAAISRISELGVAVGMSAFVFASALTSVTPPSTSIPVSDVAVVEDMLEQPQPKVYRWTVRIIPASLDDEMVRMIHWLKLDRPTRLNDNIDSTIPPHQPEVPTLALAETPQPPLLRQLTPLR